MFSSAFRYANIFILLFTRVFRLFLYLYNAVRFSRRNILKYRVKQMHTEIYDGIISRKMARRQNLLELQRRFNSDNEIIETELYPFSLGPVEMWDTIFGYFTDTTDLLNCMDTCSQFAGMLLHQRTKFLFEQVFPFLVGHLKRRGTLKCRKICKTWCCTVDKLLENAYLLPREENHRNMPYRMPPMPPMKSMYTYRGTIGVIPPRRSGGLILHRNAMRSHSRNPLLGRNVSINVIVNRFEERAVLEPRVRVVFSDFGPHLFHVELSFAHLQFRPRQYFSLICHILHVCESLKTLKLRTLLSDDDDDETLTEDELNYSSDDIPINRSLELLQTSEVWRPGPAIEQALIIRYSNQLNTWNSWYRNGDLYEKLPWENLTCLELQCASTGLKSIGKMEAPRLEEITLGLNLVRTPPIREVINALDHFPLLKSCTLHFRRDESGFGDDEFLKTDHISKLVWSRSITCLNLRLKILQKCNLSYDFLVFFPYLERLSIKFDEGIENQPLRSLTHGYHSSDFIQLAQYISEESLNRNDTLIKPIYRSNIWQVLSCLKVLKIKRTVNSDDFVPTQEAEYTRLAYEASLCRVNTFLHNF